MNAVILDSFRFFHRFHRVYYDNDNDYIYYDHSTFSG